MDALEKAILKTLLYADIFSYPLTEKELYPRLIDHKTRPPMLKSSLKNLLQKGTIKKTQNLYHLPSRKKIVSLRKTRNKYADQKLSLAHTLTQKHLTSPPILAVLATGSLAAKNPKKSDDLDLLLITHNNLLWTTRLLLTPYLDLLHLRRKPNQKGLKIKNKLCLNLYLTPVSLTLPKSSRSLYIAYEIIQTLPLLNRQNTHQTFLAKNSWLKDHLPNFPLPDLKKTSYPTPPNPLEPLAYRLQHTYMQPKKTNEQITRNSAFFHPQNLTPAVDRKLKKAQKRYNLNLF